MRQTLMLLVIGGAIIAVALYLGAPASAVLIAAFLVLCCGAMIFGMRHKQ